MIDPILKDEPDYTQDEIDKDKKTIEDKLNFINANILKELVNLPMAQRESILLKLDELTRILSKQP